MATPHCIGREISCAQERIRQIIARSKVPEDPAHAEDTLNILMAIYPEADIGLRLAALGHDIERAFPEGIKVEPHLFASYDEFKWRHSKNSARIIKGVLLRCRVHEKLAQRVHDLVLHHEFGGTKDADILKDADSLSFFHTNLPLFMDREPYVRVLERVNWGAKRLSPRGMAYLRRHVRREPLLDEILKDAGIELA